MSRSYLKNFRVESRHPVCAVGSVLKWLWFQKNPTRSKPLSTPAVLDSILAELNEQQPPFLGFIAGLIFPTGDNRTHIVDVPIRLGLERALTALDLDVTPYIPVGQTLNASSVDRDITSLIITHWPLDDPIALPRSYTIIVAPQRFAGQRESRSSHPANQFVNRLIPGLPIPWQGNILVFRSKVGRGGRTGQIEDLREEDSLLVRQIVSRQAAQAIFWRRVVGRVGAFLVGYNAAPRAKSNACDMFFDIVCATDILALVTLSAALDESTQAGTEHYNLNIIAPHAYRKQWQKLLELEFGFKRPSRLRASTTPAAEFQGHATTKWTFVRGVKVINIVWSVSPNILRTVFAAKVTAEMNILTRNHGNIGGIGYTLYTTTDPLRRGPGWKATIPGCSGRAVYTNAPGFGGAPLT
ncbi:hypothetical protein B0H15DRAFT_795564 [Mycena belliarum]|uniref:Uncharacterized protein n=1 Tax=Mycena belliarum TaxID=1033014 RepID=A0AAD6UHJ0_9AGAR|nr:hypothetical protein B0H15DRAFT_795564 [Mycena belliae]